MLLKDVFADRQEASRQVIEEDNQEIVQQDSQKDKRRGSDNLL